MKYRRCLIGMEARVDNYLGMTEVGILLPRKFALLRENQDVIDSKYQIIELFNAVYIHG